MVPSMVLHQTYTCGLLVVRGDSKYHFIMSSTFLTPVSLHLVSPPSLLHCVYESWPQKQLFDVVCGYGTVQLRIQFSRLT